VRDDAADLALAAALGERNARLARDIGFKPA